MGRAARKQRGGAKTRSAKGPSGADRVAHELIDLARESGDLPWTRPWNVAGLARNVIRNREYRGINPFYLGAVASHLGYDSNRWLTYNQAREESFQQWRRAKGMPDNDDSREAHKKDPDGYGGVRKGEKGVPIVFFRLVPKKENGQPVLDKNGKLEMRKIRGSHTVFNVEQTDLHFPEEVEERDEVEIIKAAEDIASDYPESPSIQHGGNEASYSPGEDRIRMPRRERFHTDADYYHTLFHEMIHSTGHRTRTDRAKGSWSGMASESYAEEELVAEIGAAILSARAGLPPRQERSAAYLQSWMKRLEDDPDLLLRASTKAQTAVDHILGTQFEEN